MKFKLVPALAGALCVSATATADLTGLTTEVKIDDATEANGLFVCNVYANFDGDGDRLLSIGFADVTSSTGAFWQHQLGLDTAPLDFLIPIDPLVAYDSFVSIGVKVNVGGTDGTTPDPDFNSSMFNNDGHLVGGWFNNNPDNGQGDPVNLQVLIAQLVIQNPGANDSIGGSLTVFWKDGDDGMIIGSDVSFNHPVPAPGALALLGIAGLAGRRRRRA